MKTKQKATKLLALVIIVICALFANYAINQQDVSAISASYDNAIIQKAMLTGMIGCYENGVFTSPTKELSEIWGIANIIDLNNNINVALPSGLTGDKTNVTDCDILLNGVPDGYIYGNARQVLGDLTGIFEGSGHSDYSGDIDDPEQKVSFLENMAYQQMDAKKECVYYTFLADGDRAYTENICYKNNSLYIESSGGDRGTGAIFSPHNDVFLTVELNGKTYEDIASTVRGWDVFKRELETFISNTVVREWGNGYRYEGMVENTHGDSRYAFPSVVSGAPQYTRYEKAIRTFSTKGYKSYPDLKFTDEEKLTYYVEALKNWLFKDQKVADYQRCDISDPATNTKYKMIKIDLSNNSPSDTCGVDPDIAVNDYIFGFTSDGYFDYTGNTKLTLSDVIYEINQLVDAGAIPGTVTGASDDPCLSSGAAGNMGWLVCNILKVAQEATTGIYNGAVEPLLQVEPELFAGNSSTRQAWSIFQGFANILFVIFFLFVIFSQLTGIGIDNYGIKKIMPKLIITAILINLSYLLCQIAIDLSNIFGNGIQGIFDNMDLAVSAPGIGGINVGTEISVFLASSLTAGAIVASVALNPAILLGLLVGVLGVLIAIFFMFILLSMRQAALVVLTVISPIAFVLYMLPNTKSLFDKWLKAGKALLLLYPICALLVAGGDFVSRLLLSIGYAADNIWSSLVAMVVGIVPIFFIPTVLKGSLAAIGNIGATVSNLGNRLRGGATKGIRNSGAYKNVQERSKERSTRLRAGIGADGKPIDMNLFQRISRGSLTRRSIARNRAQYNKDQKDRDAENLLLDPTYMGNMEAHRATALSNEREKMYTEVYERETDRSKVEAELNTALRGNDAERASAAFNSLIKKGGIDEAFNALKGANWSSMNSNVRDRVVQAMSGSGVDAMKAYATYRNTNGKASFDNWAHGRVNAGDSVANTKYKTYAEYLQKQKEHAIDNYGKDEMQFVDGLKSELYSQMGKDDYGAMMGSALLNSTNAQAQDIVDRIATSDITNGNLRASDYRFSSKGLSTIRQEAALSLGNGYLGRGETLNDLRNDLQVPIRGIKADPRMAGSMGQVTRGIFNI